MKPDPVIDRVRAARHAISERFGHDPQKLVEYYLKRQSGIAESLTRPKEEELKDEKG